MKTNYKMRRGFTLVELLVVIVIIAALAGLTAPMVIRQRNKANQTEAVSNARQVGFAMFEFETEYGSFPDAALGETINTNVGGDLIAPSAINSSNDAFTQLLAAGIATSEQMFFCKTSYSTQKPDNVFTKKGDALKKGDVGFGYIMEVGNKAFSASGNSGRVLIAAPLKYSGSFTDQTTPPQDLGVATPFSSSGSFTAKQFDKDAYDSKAVVLKMDNSVTSLQINNDGEAVLGGTKKLFDSGADTVWGEGVTPTMVNPLPK